MSKRIFDLICLGRAAVDLYGQQVGARLEDEASFAKYLGGSAANTAYGCSILGLKSAMLTRVGDEHMGNFVRESLENAGVDVSHVKTDTQRLTGLVLLGIKDKDTFPLIFYRNDCADMAVSAYDFNEAFIASAKAFLVNGTHCSTANTYNTTKQALAYAKANAVKTVFDIDYRPVLWGLTSLGDGETRFISDQSVTEHLQTLLADFDLIVGTEEEIHIAGGSEDTIEALETIRSISQATVVLKRGALGASVYPDAIPTDLDQGITVKGVKVDVLNVLGAGDAFMSGFLRGWINNEPHEVSLRYANACGALVVSRHGCAPAMPTAEELDDYIERLDVIDRPDLDKRLNYLHRVATRDPKTWPELCVLALDHRQQFVDMARRASVSSGHIPHLKKLLVQAAEAASERTGIEGKFGLLLDDTYGQDSLDYATGKDWWVGRPIELPGSRPLEIEGRDDIGTRLKSWPVEQVVKCLVFYHPDDPVALRLAQERQIVKIYNACCHSGHEFLLELILPHGSAVDELTLFRAMERIYNLDVYPDWWKLPPQTPVVWQKIDALIKRRAPHCRGIVILGLAATAEKLKKGFAESTSSEMVKGFAVGRTIFAEPCQQWLENKIDSQSLIDQVSDNYVELIEFWQQRRIRSES